MHPAFRVYMGKIDNAGWRSELDFLVWEEEIFWESKALCFLTGKELKKWGRFLEDGGDVVGTLEFLISVSVRTTSSTES